jgi:hypothetical protein
MVVPGCMGNLFALLTNSRAVTEVLTTMCTRQEIVKIVYAEFMHVPDI